MIGIVVDSVSEVLNIKGEDIENTHLRDQSRHGLYPRHGQDGGRGKDPAGHRQGIEQRGMSQILDLFSYPVQTQNQQ